MRTPVTPAAVSPAQVCPKARKGFTLVELLVVIGIIAILISVLLPVLSSARRTANKVKCASQLREIGNALKLYQVEYKGYWPVVLHDASPTFPVSNPALRSDPPRNDYWYQFLLKYFTNRSFSGTAGKRLLDFMNTPLFGCPSVDKTDFDGSGSSAEFNSGYGMGPYAAYTETKYLGVNSGNHWAMIKQSGTPCEGQYYKMTGWARPAEKAIITDSKSWFNETRSVANVGAIVHPSIPSETSAVGYDPNASHQFDRWRHSKKRGGKNPVSMNFLYCDGHVGEVMSIEEAFKATRGHFPL